MAPQAMQAAKRGSSAAHRGAAGDPDMQISRIRLSDKTSRLHPRHVVPKRSQADEPEVPVQVREWIGPALASPDLVLDAQPPAQPHSGVVVDRPVRFGDGTYFEVVRPSAQRAVQLLHHLCGLLPSPRSSSQRVNVVHRVLNAFLRRPGEVPQMAARSEMPRPRSTSRPAVWRALEDHYGTMRGRHLRDLFAEVPARGERMTAEAAGVFLDYSKNRVEDETLSLLVELAEQSGLRERIDAMFRGEKINVTENRAVLHVALRAPRGTSIVVDGKNVVPEVHAVLDKMAEFANRI